jgi:hypothetical protein
MTQRDKMRELIRLYGCDKERVCAEYIRAEERGEVTRRSQTKTAERYADDIYRDGLHKGWLQC